MAFAISVDTGGTFSDLVLADSDRIVGLYKAPTTPQDPFEGVLEALGLAASAESLSVPGLLARTTSVVYATTTATNAMLQGATARTALLTTEGHRDILLYREGGKSDPLNIAVPYPAPYVPRSLTFGIRERIMADGSVREPLDERHVQATLRRLGELDVQAVGVCLLWAMINPGHELRIGELIGELLPGVEVTLSHTLNPIVREYRRASATVIDASLKPLMRRHLGDVDRRLRELGFRGEPLLATHLSGGVLHLHDMCEQPLHSVDSGPALAPVAGLASAAAEPESEGLEVVVVDAGGTSLDISPTRDRRVLYTREKWFGPKWQGHMTGLPAVDTRSVGAGGGSIASVDSGGYLTVGPQSAGSVPGPACYGRGGEEATVTDAAVVLGYIDAGYFLGGRLTLDAARATEALQRRVAGPLGWSVERAAGAVLAVFSEKMRSFIGEMTINQGLDPRRSLVVGGGGASGLNIIAVARELGVPKAVIPTMAAGLSAIGGQYAPIVGTFSMPMATTTSAFDYDGVNATLGALSRRMDAFVSRVGCDGPARRQFFAEARYANQLWELDLSIGARRRFDPSEGVGWFTRAFDELHQSVFAVSQPGEAVEVVTWRGDVRIARGAPALASRPAAAGVAAGTPAPTRTVWIDGEPLDTPVHRAETLGTGEVVKGPAVVEEPSTTIVVIPGSAVHVRPGHYLVEVGP